MTDSIEIDALLIQLTSNPYFDMVSSYSIGQLGLYYLAEYADKAGYNVKVKYYNSFDNVYELLPELINKSRCRIIGFYTDSENIWTIRMLTPSLKKLYPNLHIILGGPQVTGDPSGTLQLIPHITCGIIGEGELPFLKLIQSKSLNEKTLETINNLIYFNANNVLKRTKLQLQKQHIDDYGFPRREKYCLDPDKVTFSQLISGRGCIGKCAFCFEGAKTHSNIRVRSINSCLDEVDYLVNTFNIKYINFVDDTFILNRKRTEEFCYRMIDKYDGKIKWYCEARADILSKNIDILPLLKQAGLIKIQLGGESGCQEILDIYKKGVTLEEIEFTTKKIAEAGIPYIYINFIIGGAFETETTFNKTLNFAKKLLHIAPGHVEIDSSVFTPAPGSPMYQHSEFFGLKVIDKRILRGSSCSFVFAETEELNQYKIWQLRNRFKNEINHEYSTLIHAISRKQLIEIF
ncbi:MAG: B12-binding domain-containing radical SAM protein, partial [Clostridiales bacterium]|nr:B12-binding domain-containing radical SAM protein [Clostridiales bacterium]